MLGGTVGSDVIGLDVTGFLLGDDVWPSLVGLDVSGELIGLGVILLATS